MRESRMNSAGKEKPRLPGRGEHSEVLINFLDTSYDKVEDKSIFIEFATGAYPAMCVALAKAKLVQVEKGGAI